MASDKQIAQARINGAKSRGPKSREGRLRCALLAHVVVLPGESRPRFNELLRSLQDELQPESMMEHLMVQKMAVAQWRQIRTWGMETTTIDHDAQTSAAHNARTSHALGFRKSNNRLGDTDTRLDLQFRRAYDLFEKRRAARQRLSGSGEVIENKEQNS
jgi:hypothetical protein